MTQIIKEFSEISSHYKAAFVDLWGCVHNGITAFAPAVKALQDYRRNGGIVVLFTNSPRVRSDVEKQLAIIGVPRDAWDTIATSGDSARAALFSGCFGKRIFVIGKDNGENFFKPMKLIKNPPILEYVDIDQAESIVCLDMNDNHSHPEDTRPLLEYAAKHGLKLLCANPDICVDKGNYRQWCAGAVAQLYTEIGGRSYYFGKPHAPIYDLATRRLNAIDTTINKTDIIAVGDGIATDVQGSKKAGIDCLFISGGLAAKETGTLLEPDSKLLTAYLTQHNQTPKWTIGHLG